MSVYTNILSIAGADPCGCAGIQADILTGCCCGVHVATAVTAVTVQNTHVFKSVNPVNPQLLEAQIDAIAKDIPLKAVKIGMLPNPSLAAVVYERINRFNFQNIVIDPVGMATVGNPESGENASSISGIESILPYAAVITPNLREASVLLGQDVSHLPLRETAFRLCRKYGCKAAIVTGGDVEGISVRDGFYILSTKEDGEMVGSRIDTDNTHGSGCAFSTAIASFLALDHSIPSAIANAEKIIHKLIRAGKDFSFGKGNYGPLGYLKLNTYDNLH